MKPWNVVRERLVCHWVLVSLDSVPWDLLQVFWPNGWIKVKVRQCVTGLALRDVYSLRFCSMKSVCVCVCVCWRYTSIKMIKFISWFRRSLLQAHAISCRCYKSMQYNPRIRRQRWRIRWSFVHMESPKDSAMHVSVQASIRRHCECLLHSTSYSLMVIHHMDNGGAFIFRKFERFKQAHAMNTLAWNNKTGSYWRWGMNLTLGQTFTFTVSVSDFKVHRSAFPYFQVYICLWLKLLCSLA